MSRTFKNVFALLPERVVELRVLSALFDMNHHTSRQTIGIIMENQTRNNNERDADTNRIWMDNLMKHMQHLQRSSSTVDNSETAEKFGARVWRRTYVYFKGGCLSDGTEKDVPGD